MSTLNLFFASGNEYRYNQSNCFNLTKLENKSKLFFVGRDECYRIKISYEAYGIYNVFSLGLEICETYNDEKTECTEPENKNNNTSHNYYYRAYFFIFNKDNSSCNISVNGKLYTLTKAQAYDTNTLNIFFQRIFYQYENLFFYISNSIIKNTDELQNYRFDYYLTIFYKGNLE